MGIIHSFTHREAPWWVLISPPTLGSRRGFSLFLSFLPVSRGVLGRFSPLFLPVSRVLGRFSPLYFSLFRGVLEGYSLLFLPVSRGFSGFYALFLPVSRGFSGFDQYFSLFRGVLAQNSYYSPCFEGF